MTFHRDVVPGIHWLEYAYTNQYLIEDQDRLILVDCGLPPFVRTPRQGHPGTRP